MKMTMPRNRNCTAAALQMVPYAFSFFCLLLLACAVLYEQFCPSNLSVSSVTLCVIILIILDPNVTPTGRGIAADLGEVHC